ncbi:MAG TPA: adenylate/guanylate cyclase domain-containing protein [Methylomirabilota bacterium]|nr:adenylate/guanylate cyclase domain-containing protein [Methylomirabilota bacterium]
MAPDLEHERWLWRLRFPTDVERAFQHDYFHKSITFFRIGHLVALLLVVLLFVQGLLQGLSPAVLAGPIFPAIAGLTGLLLFSFHRSFESVWQPAATCAGSALNLYLIYALVSLGARSLPTADPKFNFLYVVLRECFLLVATFVVPRLTFRWMMVAFAAQLAGATVILASTTSAPIARIAQAQGIFALPIAILLLLSGYTLERYRRSDYLANRLLDAERERSESLLLNILPASVAARLKANPEAIADSYGEVTVLFADIVDFTPLSARLAAPELVRLLNQIFSAFDSLADKHGLEKIKTIGDAYMVVGGLPDPHPAHAVAVADMALDMQQEIARFVRGSSEPPRLRIGIDTGSVVAGVIGTRKFAYDLWGDTVNMASRMESHGSPGMIQVTERVFRCLRDRFDFGAPQQLQIKGRGVMTTYQLVGRKPLPAA